MRVAVDTAVSPGFRGRLPDAPPPNSQLVQRLALHDELLLILGPNGSGKSLLAIHVLAERGLRPPEPFTFEPRRAVVSHPAFGAPKNAIARLSVCGLGTVKSWLAPYETLSGGQRARVDVALSLTQQRGALIEDLGRRLDPHSGCMVAAAVGRASRARINRARGVIVTSSRPELCPWLSPDIVVVLDGDGNATVLENPLPRNERRPRLDLRYVATQDPCLFASGKSASANLSAVLRDSKAHYLTNRPRRVLECRVLQDAGTAHAASAFDIAFLGVVKTRISPSPASVVKQLTNFRLEKEQQPPRIGLLLGPSGSGKSSHLAELAAANSTSIAAFVWADNVAIVSQMDTDTPAYAIERLDAVGFPAACRLLPHAALSGGLQHLALLARALSPGDRDTPAFVCIDELASDLDPQTAHRACVGMAAYIRSRRSLAFVFASVSNDALLCLQPDWLYDVSASRIDAYKYTQQTPPPPPPPPAPVVDAAQLFRRVILSGVARPCRRDNAVEMWNHLAEYHYLSADLAKPAYPYCYSLRMDCDPAWLAAFVALKPSSLHKPSATDGRDCFSEHRLVVHPSWQGVGLWPALSVLVCREFATALPSASRRIFANTANVQLGQKRSSCGAWDFKGRRQQIAGSNLANTSSVERLLFRHELRDVQKLWEQRHGYAARERKQPTLVEMFTQASPPSKRKQSEGDDQGSPAK